MDTLKSNHPPNRNIPPRSLPGAGLGAGGHGKVGAGDTAILPPRQGAEPMPNRSPIRPCCRQLVPLAVPLIPELKKPLVVTFTNGLVFTGAPGEIRTPYPLVRSQVLYPDELRALRSRDYT